MKDTQYRLNLEAEEHTKADHDFKLTLSRVFSISRRAGSIFSRSEPSEKRALINFLIQNPTVDGKTLGFTLRSPFNTVLEIATQPTGLPLVDEFRTANWIGIKSELQFSGILGLFENTLYQNKHV